MAEREGDELQPKSTAPTRDCTGGAQTLLSQSLSSDTGEDSDDLNLWVPQEQAVQARRRPPQSSALGRAAAAAAAAATAGDGQQAGTTLSSGPVSTFTSALQRKRDVITRSVDRVRKKVETKTKEMHMNFPVKASISETALLDNRLHKVEWMDGRGPDEATALEKWSFVKLTGRSLKKHLPRVFRNFNHSDATDQVHPEASLFSSRQAMMAVSDVRAPSSTARRCSWDDMSILDVCQPPGICLGMKRGNTGVSTRRASVSMASRSQSSPNTWISPKDFPRQIYRSVSCPELLLHQSETGTTFVEETLSALQQKSSSSGQENGILSELQQIASGSSALSSQLPAGGCEIHTTAKGKLRISTGLARNLQRVFLKKTINARDSGVLNRSKDSSIEADVLSSQDSEPDQPVSPLEGPANEPSVTPAGNFLRRRTRMPRGAGMEEEPCQIAASKKQPGNILNKARKAFASKAIREENSISSMTDSPYSSSNSTNSSPSSNGVERHPQPATSPPHLFALRGKRPGHDDISLVSKTSGVSAGPDGKAKSRFSKLALNFGGGEPPDRRKRTSFRKSRSASPESHSLRPGCPLDDYGDANQVDYCPSHSVSSPPDTSQRRSRTPKNSLPCLRLAVTGRLFSASLSDPEDERRDASYCHVQANLVESQPEGVPRSRSCVAFTMDVGAETVNSDDRDDNLVSLSSGRYSGSMPDLSSTFREISVLNDSDDAVDPAGDTPGITTRTVSCVGEQLAEEPIHSSPISESGHFSLDQVSYNNQGCDNSCECIPPPPQFPISDMKDYSKGFSEPEPSTGDPREPSVNPDTDEKGKAPSLNVEVSGFDLGTDVFFSVHPAAVDDLELGDFPESLSCSTPDSVSSNALGSSRNSSASSSGDSASLSDSNTAAGFDVPDYITLGTGRHRFLSSNEIPGLDGQGNVKSQDEMLDNVSSMSDFTSDSTDHSSIHSIQSHPKRNWMEKRLTKVSKKVKKALSPSVSAGAAEPVATPSHPAVHRCSSPSRLNEPSHSLLVTRPPTQALTTAGQGVSNKDKVASSPKLLRKLGKVGKVFEKTKPNS